MVTFWSGIAGDGPDGPLLFCTCAGIHGPDGRRTIFQRAWGWATIAAARARHQAVTAWSGQVAEFLAGQASRLPSPGPAPVRHATGPRPSQGAAGGFADSAARRYSALIRWASSSWSSRMMMRQAASMEVPWSTSSRARAAMRSW